MRQPPSPLLLSARKRRPRRNPPRGAQLGAPATPEGQQQSQAAPEGEKCALLERTPEYGGKATRPDDDEPTASSR